MSKKIFAHNMNDKSIKTMQWILDALFVWAFESSTLSKDHRDIVGVRDTKKAAMLSLATSDPDYKKLENEVAALSAAIEGIESKQSALKTYISGLLFDQKSGRGKEKKVVPGLYSSLGIGADFVYEYYKSESSRNAAIKNLVASFGLDLNDQLVRSLCKSLGISLGYRATSSKDTMSGIFIKEQSILTCQKIFGRALVQFLSARCDSLIVHTVEEKAAVPEFVTCRYSSDGKTLLDYQIKEVTTPDENGIKPGGHKKECSPAPADAAGYTDRLRQQEEKVKKATK